ncbi:MAG: hypothetical protein PVI06_19370 [Desulfobacterales bacterium]|jgi:CheY-like chemotaxis protein
MKSTIVVIDDDKKLNKLLKDYLSDFGFHTEAATHPDEGLRKLTSWRPATGKFGSPVPRILARTFFWYFRRHSSLPHRDNEITIVRARAIFRVLSYYKVYV